MSPFLLESKDSALRLVLTGEVTVQYVHDLHDALVAALTFEATLNIDAREVSRLDAAVVQVLLAAACTAKNTEIVGASTAWTQALQRFGLADAFHRPASFVYDLP